MTNSDDDAPLPLSELTRWMSKEVSTWIKEGDEKEERLKLELEDNAAFNVSNLFGEDSDDDTGTNKRIQTWSSSSRNLDGRGGFQSVEDKRDEDADEDALSIVFILSESYQGFGDILWSSARYIANVLADPSKCRDILAPMLLRKGDEERFGDSKHLSPLYGTTFLELGAGAGVPSWAAMKCGARVVCTDLSDTNRIRSMGECAERNFRQMESSGEILNGDKARVCPHDWGSPIDDVARALNPNGEERFDVIIAADCCYMPWSHSDLLDSIDKLLSNVGVALVPFALHGNTNDDEVWKIVDRAKDKDFVVEVLPSQQLSPPNRDMDSKQGLVHTVRLSKKIK